MADEGGDTTLGSLAFFGGIIGTVVTASLVALSLWGPDKGGKAGHRLGVAPPLPSFSTAVAESTPPPPPDVAPPEAAPPAFAEPAPAPAPPPAPRAANKKGVRHGSRTGGRSAK